MNHIGHHAPNHEPVGFIHPDRREFTVPWDEPAKGSAFVHFELFNSEFAIYESYHKVAFRASTIRTGSLRTFCSHDTQGMVRHESGVAEDAHSAFASLSCRFFILR